MKAPTLTKPQRATLETAADELRTAFKKLNGKIVTVEEMERRLEAAREEHAKLSANDDLGDETIALRIVTAERTLKLLPGKIEEAYAEIAPGMDESHAAAHACLVLFDEHVYTPGRQLMIGEIAKSLLPFSADEASARRLAERSDACAALLHWRQRLAGNSSRQDQVQSIQRLLKALAAALAGDELFSFPGAAVK
ncbi:MAG: hypothetical protein ABMA01_22605 [Chthoniobacteraceae bacterium]